jgi:hypothetical protein
MLVKESHYHAFGTLRQAPRLHPHRQSRVQFQALATMIPERPQFQGHQPAAVIQTGGVFNQQIFSRLPAGLPGALHMGRLHSLMGHSRLSKKTVGGFEFRPVRKNLRHGSAGNTG